MLPMRLRTPAQTSMASVRVVLPLEACPTMAKFRMSAGRLVFIALAPVSVVVVGRSMARKAGNGQQLFLIAGPGSDFGRAVSRILSARPVRDPPGRESFVSAASTRDPAFA